MFKTNRWMLAAMYVPSVAVIGAVAAMSVYGVATIDVFTRDPVSVAGVHPLTGILSNLGILLWCSSAATCLFGSVVCFQQGSKAPSRFLLSSGLLTLTLLFDDLLQFHELLAAQYLGLSEKMVYGVYGMAIAAYLVFFWRSVLQTWALPFCLAFAFFGFSLVIDVVLGPWLWRLDSWVYLLEDGAKFLGIASWCGYFAHTSFQFIAAGPVALINQAEKGVRPLTAAAGADSYFTAVSTSAQARPPGV